jgi:uncharacterized protein
MVKDEAPQLIARLRRIEGHLAAVIAMMDRGRSSLELAQQLHAVERAIAATKRELIHAHIETGLAAVLITEANPLLSEMRSLAKYL